MSSRAAVIDGIKKHRLVAIFRGIPAGLVAETARALVDGGVRVLEVTFDQRDLTAAPAAIRTLKDKFGDRLHVGAGTVMTAQQVSMAHEAGAELIVSPGISEAVVSRTLELGLVSIPGALTPTEIARAHACGADFVKLFPAGELGLAYVKAVRAPLGHIDMLAVGGIDLNNVRQFLDIGLCGAGIGSNLVNRSLAGQERFDELTGLARAYVRQTGLAAEEGQKI